MDYSISDIVFSKQVYEPESLFSEWLNLSYILLTTGLLFYHMSRVKTINTSPRLAAIIAICIILTSSGFMLFAMGPYMFRMNHVIEKCKSKKACSKLQVGHLKQLKMIYVSLGIGSIIIQGLIVFLIFKNIQV